MAVLKLYHDTRRIKENGTYPLKLKIFHNDKARYIPLNYSFTKKEWSSKDHKVKSTYPNSARTNASIRKLLTKASVIVAENEDALNALTISELKDLLSDKLFGKKGFDEGKKKQFFLLEYSQTLINRLKKANRFGSADSYRDTQNSFNNYLKGKDILLTGINHKFLEDYEAQCLGRGLKVNTIGMYLRTLRAIVNKAINEGHLSQESYPFRKFKIKKEETQKRAITKEEISQVLNVQLNPDLRIWHSRNYFAFMFNMRGMNFVDLAYLRGGNIQKDRILYRRIKTGKLYNIKLTEKAVEILNYYTKGERLEKESLIFPILPIEVLGNEEEERKRYRNRRKYFNKDLKKIAEICKLETNLTSYVTRHTWASIAKFSGVTPAVIGESLGHSDLKTTETYLANFEYSVLDDANELIVG